MKGRPITIKPSSGGALMSSLSQENIGVANYTIKQNMRRRLDRELRAEGFAKFCPKIFEGEIPMPASVDDITLAIMLRHPNGRTAVIVGTATTIWKYTGVDDPLYVKDDYIVAEYFVDMASAWSEIGSGFSATGRRWEACLVNGYLVLNNAADLPVTYRLPDRLVSPIYELRELAVASVGTIAVYNEVLFTFDIRQIKSGNFENLMRPVDSAVNAFVLGVGDSMPDKATVNSGVAGVVGNTITADGGSFNSGSGFTGMEGRIIRMLNGVERSISSVTSSTVATLDGDPVLVEPAVKFFIPRDHAFHGYYYDFVIQPKISDLWPGVNFAITPANPEGEVGLKVWWDSGESAIIIGTQYDEFTGDAFFRVNSDKPIPSGPCKLESPNSYGIFEDEAQLDRIQWRNLRSRPNQPRRFGATYPATILPTSNLLTLDYPVKSVPFSGGDVLITGMISGNLPATVIYSDGLRFLMGGTAVTGFYKDIISAADAAAVAEQLAHDVLAQTTSTLVAANASLVLAKESASQSPNDSVLSQNVTTASAAVDIAQSAVTAAEASLAKAVTTRDEADAKVAESESVEIQLADAVSDLSHIDDLQDDSSAILRALPLRNALIIYKETCIFICRQSGANFVFSPPIKIEKSYGLFYRNTLIEVDGMFHLYAAENKFCRFDMTWQVPRLVEKLQVCQNEFFNEAKPDNMEKIFSADNPITSEILICFPTNNGRRALALDYEFNTVASSTLPITCGAAVTFPGRLETIFLIGGAGGRVYRYGMTAGPVRTMSGLASKTGIVVTAVVRSFSEGDIGQTIKFVGGQRFGIVNFISEFKVEVAGSGNVTAQVFSIEPTCYHYDGGSYTSILQSGGDAFQSESSEKKLHRYNLMLSSFSPQTSVTAVIRSGRNVDEVADKITASITPPRSLVPVVLSDYFISDRVEIAGMNNPAELTSRVFSLSGIKADSFGRRKL